MEKEMNRYQEVLDLIQVDRVRMAQITSISIYNFRNQKTLLCNFPIIIKPNISERVSC